MDTLSNNRLSYENIGSLTNTLEEIKEKQIHKVKVIQKTKLNLEHQMLMKKEK